MPSDVVTFRGKHSLRSKVVLDDTPLEQVTKVNYFACYVTYEYNEDYLTSEISVIILRDRRSVTPKH